MEKLDITEALIEKYARIHHNINDVITYIIEAELKFQFEICKDNGNSPYDMSHLFHYLEQFENMTVDFLRKNGYYLSKRGIQKDKKHRMWFELVFDPIKQLNIAQQVLNKHRYAYHTTPIQNADSIDIEGIKAQKEFKPYESYQKRVNLYIDNPSSQDYINMMNDISKNLSSKNKNFVGDFVDYEIRLNKLPQDTVFFIDVHEYNKDFVYITTDIPTSAITNSEEKTYV